MFRRAFSLHCFSMRSQPQPPRTRPSQAPPLPTRLFTCIRTIPGIHSRVDLRRWSPVRKHGSQWPVIPADEDLSTGRVLQHYDLPAQYFGEGLTDWGSTLVQLTWTSHKGFVYDRFSFSLLRTFQYEGEGWGLTHDDRQLIMSDGTSYLRFLDPKSFRETRRIHVIDEAGVPSRI